MEALFSSLESATLRRGEIDLARGALVASGVRDSTDLDRYVAAIDVLTAQASPHVIGHAVVDRARALFDWLWTSKPNRSEPGGSFRLTHVIDAQLDPRIHRIGNCLGLTLLYNLLGQRFEIQPHAVYLEAVSGRLSHVISGLRTDGVAMDIDNIFPHGFDIKDYLDNPHRTEWGDAELIADVYHSIGWELHETGDLRDAIASYSKAIWLNPHYVKAYLNRGIALSMLGRDHEASRDLEIGGYQPSHG